MGVWVGQGRGGGGGGLFVEKKKRKKKNHIYLKKNIDTEERSTRQCLIWNSRHKVEMANYNLISLFLI